MLAQNFLDASSLGISDQERDALISVLGMLERGELVWNGAYDHRVPHGFNMGVVHRQDHCGTTACILGWARILGKDGTLFTVGERPRAVEDLFFCTPSTELALDRAGRPSLEATSTEEAATLLRSYLTRGAPHWDEALSVT